MTDNAENIIKKIDFSMRMENMPLSKEDKSHLRGCIKENRDISEVLQEIVINHTFNKEFVSLRKKRKARS
jgi:hypothetical protein